MSVAAAALVPGASFRVAVALRTYCCDGTIPAGALVTIIPPGRAPLSPNRLYVTAEPGGTHKVRRSSLRMAAEERN